MHSARRDFLKQFAGALSVLLGGTQLAGCLEESDPPPTVASGSPGSDSPMSAAAAARQPLPPSVATQNSGPVWTPAPTIELVEGVPAVVSVRNFVRDPNSDPLVITLTSGTLIPGLSWDPAKATITYDGRAFGATEDAPIVMSGLTFDADNRKP
jgi:hypothetical protein